MNINPTNPKRSCRNRKTEKQAIRDSLAPFAPFPGAFRKSDNTVSRNKPANTTV